MTENRISKLENLTPQAYLAQMEKERGYVLDFHKILAQEDFEFLKSYNSLLQSGYLNEESENDSKTKELILIAVLISVRSPSDHIKTHMYVAKQLGVTKSEMFEVVKMCLVPAGLSSFMEGFSIWREVFEIQN